MWDYDELKSFNVSNAPKTLVDKFDYIAKRMGMDRSKLIKLIMECAVTNAQFWFERHATTKQFIQHAINDSMKIFGIQPMTEDPKIVQIGHTKDSEKTA